VNDCYETVTSQVKTNSSDVICLYTVSKNDTDVAHCDFNAHQPILLILAEILLSEYAIER